MFISIASLVLSASAAVSWQPVEQIRAAAENAITQSASSSGRVEVQASVDDNLRMPLCQSQVDGRVNGPGTVEVFCNDPAGWRLFVPVRVRRIDTVLVLTRAVNAGETLSEFNTTLEERDLSKLSGGSIASLAQLSSRTVARTLPAGKVLLQNDFTVQRLVKRGQIVTVIYRNNGLEVRSKGKALSDASVSDSLSVENSGSRRVVNGVVNANGELEVGT